MRQLPTEITNYLQQNSGVKTRVLLWVEARNRTTGVAETIGLWNGEDHRQFVIDGQTRTYYGCGNFIQVGTMSFQSGLNIRRFTIAVSPITPEIDLVLRDYDPKFAPTQVHLAFYNTETNNLIAPPVKMFKGWIDKFPIKTPSVGGEGDGKIEMVGHTRLLTKRLALKRSNDTQRQRNASDTVFSDVSITGQISTPWGSKTVATRTGAFGQPLRVEKLKGNSA